MIATSRDMPRDMPIAYFVRSHILLQRSSIPPASRSENAREDLCLQELIAAARPRFLDSGTGQKPKKNAGHAPKKILPNFRYLPKKGMATRWASACTAQTQTTFNDFSTLSFHMLAAGLY